MHQMDDPKCWFVVDKKEFEETPEGGDLKPYPVIGWQLIPPYKICPVVLKGGLPVTMLPGQFRDLHKSDLDEWIDAVTSP